jgi:iron only hydrogenase large subunit-like protein
VDDYKDLAAFADRFRQSPRRPIDDWLMGQLSPKTREALARFKGKPWQKLPLQAMLAQDFNKMIKAGSIHNTNRFADVTLREETEDLLRENLQGEELQRLNRLLLEDAYPLELSRSRKRASKITDSELLLLPVVASAAIALKSVFIAFVLLKFAH